MTIQDQYDWAFLRLRIAIDYWWINHLICLVMR
jgi:hypothetical protein